MKQLDPSHHHHSQWVPKVIEVRLHLSERSLKPQNRFYSRISTQEGYYIDSSCFFTTTSRDSDNSFRVQIARNPNNEEKPISFHVASPLGEVSAVCSKLNMSNAMKCQIVGRLDNEFVSFSIIAPDEATEKRLLWYFSTFEVGSQTTH